PRLLTRAVDGDDGGAGLSRRRLLVANLRVFAELQPVRLRRPRLQHHADHVGAVPRLRVRALRHLGVDGADERLDLEGPAGALEGVLGGGAHDETSTPNRPPQHWRSRRGPARYPTKSSRPPSSTT